jgi:transcriptional regulator NrdR family protein
MNCTTCDNKTEILETRAKGNEMIRKRYCKTCKVRFETREIFSRLIRSKQEIGMAGANALHKAWSGK